MTDDPSGTFEPLVSLLVATARDETLADLQHVEPVVLHTLHALVQLFAVGARLVWLPPIEGDPGTGRWRLHPRALTLNDWRQIGTILQGTDPRALALLETALATLAPPGPPPDDYPRPTAALGRPPEP